MKKVFAMILTVLIIFGVVAVANAEGDMKEITIKNTYTVTNEGTSYPDETFAYTIEKTGITEAGVLDAETNETVSLEDEDFPMPTVADVAFAAADGTATKNVTVTLPEYKTTGIYTYEIKQIAGKTAGTVYHDDPIKLVVSVIEQDGKIRIAAVHTEEIGKEIKSDSIENFYNAGDLVITKVVAGNLGDREKYFEVTVTLQGNADKTYQPIQISGGSHEENPQSVTLDESAQAEIVLKLKHDDTVKLLNIPYDVTYTVKEADYTATDQYSEALYEQKTLVNGQEVWLSEDGGSANNTIELNRVIDTPADYWRISVSKDAQIETGVVLEYLPYVLILVVAVLGVVLLIVGKRRRYQK